jgi:type III restriction enzyme
VLKTYQKEALATLSRFCDLSKQKPITEAFRTLTGNQYLEVDGSTAPYVCLRVPTGGGKTLIATKSLRILSNDYLEQPYHLVLWLAPSDKIVTQTLEVLKDKRNFYRSLLDKDFDNIKILSMQEAYRQKFDPSEELVIVVGTIQSFRTNSKEGRKFYAENANYYEMLKHRDITPSMENVMKMVKPIIILDEAHKSRTSLSLENLLGLDPSFILELTATPVTQSSKAKKVYASNILYTVNAIALKRESMIKLPIMLKTLDDTRMILQEGILRRNYLEELAKLEEGISERYIRPINLIRADENRGEDAFTYDKIKETLLEMGIQEEEIAIQTGKLKEIDGVELLSRNCPIRYIITVDALKEGWDCPFAYVLSVVSQMESNTAIEQLIGRVLRMPYTEEKNKEELGYSYVYVASKNFESVAQSIGNTLIKNGFEAFEAKISIDNSANTNETIDELGGLFGERVFEDQQVYVGSEVDLEVLSKPSIAPYTNHNRETGNLTIVKFPSPSKREAFSKTLKSIVPSEKHEEIDAIMKSVEKLNPELLDKVSDFSLHYLMMEDEGELVRFEESAILEYISIETADIIANASLSQEEFNIDLKEQVGKIDISARTNQVTHETINDEASLFKDEPTNSIMEHQYGGYKSNAIAKKLGIEIAKLIVKEDNSVLKVLDSMALNEFIYLTLSRLESERGLEMQSLVAKKYQLKRAILQKLHTMINGSKIGTFNTLLKTKSFRLSNEHVLEFLPNSYQPNPDSRSSQFKKHHYQYVDKFDSYKAEYEVAHYIDGLDEVTTWVRNIARDAQNAFWLQTSNYKFYPDFIIKLANGKTVVAEYKGDMLKTTDDTKEKELIGNLWASKSDKYEFLMLYKEDYKTKLQSIL